MPRPREAIVSADRLLRDSRFSASARRAIFQKRKEYASKVALAFFLQTLARLVTEHQAGLLPDDFNADEAILFLCLAATNMVKNATRELERPPVAIAENGTPHVELARFTDATWTQCFGLANAAQFERLAAALAPHVDAHLPVPLQEALLAFFALFHRSSRLADAIRTLGVSWTVPKMSQVINQFALAVKNKFQRRLAFDARFFQPDWTATAALAVAAKEASSPGICAFIHGTSQNLAQPKERAARAAFYSDKDSRYTVRYQGVVAPNGIVTSFSGPWEGMNDDACMLNKSGLLESLERAWPAQKPWCLLGDSTYPQSKRLIHPGEGCTAATGPINAGLKQLHTMVECAVRTPGYGVTSRFEGIVDSRRMMVHERPVSAYMLTAALLTNMIACDNQDNPVAQCFGHKMPIPSLTEYMAPLSPSER